MRIDYLSSDILLFRGDSMAALATAFIDGERVLLIDALASQYDALDLRDYLETTLAKRVARIVLTDGGGAHAAALFPDALTGAPSGAAEVIEWGRHTLLLQASACGTLIDVPSADLLFAGDSLVGNIAALGTHAPDQADERLMRLLDRGRTRVVPRHTGALCQRALGHARAYLAQLRARVLELRNTLPPCEAQAAIARITIEQCLSKGELATPLERHWHADNLKQIVARGWFAANTVASAKAPRGRVQACCDTVGSVLTAMLGRLVERGV